jgi:hypothetical protein
MSFKIYKRQSGLYQFNEVLMSGGQHSVELDTVNDTVTILRLQNFAPIVKNKPIAEFFKDDIGTPYTSLEEFEEELADFFKGSIVSKDATPNVDPINIIAQSYKDPLNGNTPNMNLNFTGITSDYIFEAVGRPAQIERVFIVIQDGPQDFNSDDFGAIPDGLSTPIQLIVNRGGAELTYELEWSTNADIAAKMYDFSNPFKDGFYVGRWTLTKDTGKPVFLDVGWKQIIRFSNVDLSSIERFNMYLNGRWL